VRVRDVILPVLVFACASAPRHRGAVSLSRGELELGGRTRTFWYWKPEGAGPFALVVGLHGRLGDGQSQQTLTHFSELAAAEKFIVVFPDGYSRSWHDARDKGPAAEEQIDDVAFISQLIDRALEKFSADEKRVFVMGMSNGAFMSNTVACRLSEKIAAIGAVTGGVSANLQNSCEPKRALSVALVMGTQDPLVPFGGGEIRGDRGAILSAEDSAKFWAQKFSCAAPVASALPDLDTDDGTRTSLSKFADCSEGNEVRLYAVEGGGHTWPGGYKYAPEWMVGKVSKDFDASLELWNFFKQHGRH
jgi:polyhydroxybutyrate depolymerase